MSKCSFQGLKWGSSAVEFDGFWWILAAGWPCTFQDHVASQSSSRNILNILECKTPSNHSVLKDFGHQNITSSIPPRPRSICAVISVWGSAGRSGLLGWKLKLEGRGSPAGATYRLLPHIESWCFDPLPSIACFQRWLLVEPQRTGSQTGPAPVDAGHIDPQLKRLNCAAIRLSPNLAKQDSAYLF